MPRWHKYEVTVDNDKTTEQVIVEDTEEMAPGSVTAKQVRYARRSASPVSSVSTAGASSSGGGSGIMTGRKAIGGVSPASSPSRNGQQVSESNNAAAICGWVCACILGALASTFLLVIYLLPTEGIFPVRVQLYQKPDKPNVRQGSLRIYPGVNTSRYVHTISLDPVNAMGNGQEIYNLVQGYPMHNANEPPPEPYVHCWFSNPSRNQPCFFDQGWLGELCTEDNSYGYNETSEYLDPCFLVRIEDTADWAPEPMKPEYVTDSWKHEHDPAFLGLGCRPKEGDRSGVSIERRPVKGFSVHYFPVATFDPEYYLAPAVMVQVKGVPRNMSVNVECWLRTFNKDSLTDNGYVIVNFVPKAPKIMKILETSTQSGYSKTPRLVEKPHEVPSIPVSSETAALAATTANLTSTTEPALSNLNATVEEEEEDESVSHMVS